MQEFPRQTEDGWQITDDAELEVTLSFWHLQPALDNTIGFSAAKEGVVETFANLRQHGFHLLAPREKLFIGPLPVLFQVPPQILPFLAAQRVREQIATVAEPKRVTTQSDAGEHFCVGICRWGCQGHG
jgi:hypothetical protein